MSVSKIVASAVMALSMIAAPTLASAAPTKTSVVRTGAPMVKVNNAKGSTLVIGAIALAAIIAGIIVAADGTKRATSA